MCVCVCSHLKGMPGGVGVEVDAWMCVCVCMCVWRYRMAEWGLSKNSKYREQIPHTERTHFIYRGHAIEDTFYIERKHRTTEWGCSRTGEASRDRAWWGRGLDRNSQKSVP
jgi:hypothetical protein